MTVVLRESDIPAKDHHADLFFNLLRDSLLNVHYKNLVPDDKSPEFVYWGRYKFSGIGHDGLNNVRFCCESVIKDNIPGDFMECGVWRGGAAIMMAAVAKYYQEPRLTWLCDSFQGMPHSEDPAEDYDKLTGLIAPLQEVRDSFRLYDMLQNIVMVPGWYNDTIPTLHVGEISVLRLDNDYYESTALTIKYLYPHIPDGGYIIVDDYDCCPGCNRAVDEYRSEFGITDQMYRMSKKTGVGIYWRKGSRAAKIF